MTSILASDLKFLSAARMDDTDDSGGYPSYAELLDNEDNNLFPDVASGDRITGRTHLRKFFAAARNLDDEPLLAARAYLSLPPSDAAVSVCLLDSGGHASETRETAIEAIYTAAQQYTNSSLRLYQDYHQGDTTLSLYHVSGQTPAVTRVPAVNDVLFFEDADTAATHYARVVAVSTSSYTITLTISPPLPTTFRGDYNAGTSYVTETQIYFTRSVPLAHGIYGITQLAASAATGAVTALLESSEVAIAPTIYDQIDNVVQGSLQRKTLAVTAVDSLLQTTTINPMPTLADILVSYRDKTNKAISISGATNPERFSVSGTSITVTLTESPLRNWRNSIGVTLSQTKSINEQAFYTGKNIKKGSFSISAQTIYSEPVGGNDDGGGAIIGYNGLSGTVNYIDGIIALSFDEAVTLRLLTFNFSYETETTYRNQASALQKTSFKSFILGKELIQGSITITANRYDNGAVITGVDNGGFIDGNGIYGTINYSSGIFNIYFGSTANTVSVALQDSVTQSVLIDPMVSVSDISVSYLDSGNNFVSIRGATNPEKFSIVGTTATVTLAASPFANISYSHAPSYDPLKTVSSYTLYTGKIIHPNLVSVTSITTSGIYVIGSDDGVGTITGEGGITGTVDYANGIISLSFSTPIFLAQTRISFPYEKVSTLNPSAPSYQYTPSITSSLYSAVVPGSITVTATRRDNNVVITGTDDGNGNISGTGITTGTINYSSGFFSITFATDVYLSTINIVYTHLVGDALLLNAYLYAVSSYSANLNDNLKPGDVVVTAKDYQSGVTYSATDDGLGAFNHDGITGTINYTTGAISLTFASPVRYGSINVAMIVPQSYSEIVWTFGTNEYYDVFAGSIIIDYTYLAESTITLTAGDYPVTSYNADTGPTLVAGLVTISAEDYETGVIYTATDDGIGAFNHDGIGGTVTYETGEVALTFANAVRYSTILVSSQSNTAYSPIYWQYAATENSADFVLALKTGIVPSSVTLTALTTDDSSPLTATDNGSGALTGDATGTVDYETGALAVTFSEEVAVASLYVTYRNYEASTINSLIGGTLDVVRLPASKSYPLVKAGDMAVFHHPVATTLPNPSVASTTYSLDRANVTRIWVEDAVGTQIPDTKYTANLALGSITMAADLDLTGYNQPLVAYTVIADEVLITGLSNQNQVRFTPALTHDFPSTAAYLSTCVPLGDLGAAITAPFSQVAWTSVWQDTIIGTPIAAQYDYSSYPITVTNDGAITERWRLTFAGSTTLHITGEHIGQITLSALSTTAEIAPINPITNKPYFTIDPLGWGSGWVAGNLVRFNTTGADCGIWAIRCVQPSAVPDPGTPDRVRLTLLGDVDA